MENTPKTNAPQGGAAKLLTPHSSDMTGPEIREAIISILSDINPDEDYANMKDDVSFRDQFEMDSMDLLDIVLELRKRHRVQIPEEDYPKLDSMNSTIEYLLPLLQ